MQHKVLNKAKEEPVNTTVIVKLDDSTYVMLGDNDNNYYSRTSKDFNMITDVPVKYSFEIPGKANPNVVKIMPVISFNIGDECRIELRNVPINWK